MPRRTGLAAAAIAAVFVGAGEVVLQAFTGGGYVPTIEARREFPGVVLHGDGRLLAAGADSRESALPELATTRLDQDELDSVLAAAADAAREAPAGAIWEADGTRAQVAIRPAIGFEDRCPPEGSSYVGTGG